MSKPSTKRSPEWMLVAIAVALDAKQPVAIASAQHSRIELAERLLIIKAKIDGHKLRKRLVTGA